jgi:RNA polymerase-binding transcription factor DksA
MATKKTAKKAPSKKTAAKKTPVKKASSVAISSGGVPLTGKIARNKHFLVKVLREQLNRLLLLRERVSGEISSISLNSLSPTGRDPSLSDQGTDTFDREFALNQLSSEQDVLFEIDAAIRRLEDGTYGICEISGEAINIERLQAFTSAWTGGYPSGSAHQTVDTLRLRLRRIAPDHRWLFQSGLCPQRRGRLEPSRRA